MKKILLLFLFCAASLFRAQDNTELIAMIQDGRKLSDSLTQVMLKNKVQSDEAEYLKEANLALNKAVENALKLNDFNSAMQKVLLSPLQEYRSAFDFKTEDLSGNTLRYGFETKEAFKRHYLIAENFIIDRTIEAQYKSLVTHFQNEVAEIDEYIDRNLKRLGITHEQYEKMSKNDKLLLEKNFE